MRAPAVAIVGAFAIGILLGREFAGNIEGSLRLFLFLSIFGTMTMLAAAVVLAWRQRLATSSLLCLCSWLALGATAYCVANRPLPSDHVLNRISAGDISLKTPLRWHGRLRDNPARLPWGYGIDLDLDGVETAQGFVPLRGGMRLGFTPRDTDAALPDVRAGDEVAVLTQARLPLLYRDPGAFDRRAYLAQQNVHLLATLRASALLDRVERPAPTFATRLAGGRARLRQEVDKLFEGDVAAAGVLRAMLLGDRSFVDRAESVNYQKTGVFHVLVVAGLHVGALAFFCVWLSRLLRMPRTLAVLFLLCTVAAYIAVVEQRPPVLRAGLMAMVAGLAGFLYRRPVVLNAAAIAALLLLVANPTGLFDTSFQLSFVAIGCIAGIALPWIDSHLEPYLRGLRDWRDASADAGFAPVVVQFRLDLRSAAAVAGQIPLLAWRRAQDGLVRVFGWTLRGAELMAVSLVLQVGMLPLLARDFHRVTLLGPLGNALIVPLTGVIVPLGFFTLGGAIVAPPVGKLLAIPLGWSIALQSHLVNWLARWPRGSYRIPGPPGWVIAGFFVCVVALAVALRNGQRNWRWVARGAVAALLLAAVVIATHPFAPRVARGSLEMDVLDVAQGDSILLISPKGSTLLIDGGGAFQGFPGREEHQGSDPGEEAVSAYLWSRGIRKLDAVALTHAHQDHIGGLSAVFENFRVGELWLGRETSVPAMARLKELANARGIPVRHELRGQNFEWDGVRVEFLWPQIAPDEVAPSAKNNDSLVIRLRFGDRTLLLPGDAEKQAERTILSETQEAELHADVLKVGHHGSKNSTMPEFLEEVRPSVAVISAGEQNPYGHPSPELLERLREAGVRVLRTDENGEVSLVTDGHELRIACYVGCAEQ